MKIIIAGDGNVGYYLAKLLEPEFKDITLIDTQKDKLEFVEKTLGIATVNGDATSYKILKEAGIEKADLLIAVTSDESSNISTCVIGKKMGARFTIARINNMEYLIDKSTLDLKELGIDELISPESLAAREVKYILKSPALTEVFNFHTRELYMMGLTLEEGAPIVNKTVAEVSHLVPCNSFMVVAAYRNGQTIIPNGNFKYLTGDHLYFVSNDEGKNKVLDYAGKKNGVIKNLLIIGGSRTGKYMALRMRKYYNIKLIEKDIDRCRYLAELIPGVQIVHGDATNLDLLKEEGLEEFDAIAAVTGNSETNILSCLLAKEAGVKKNIAMIENIALFEYTQKMGIDTLINKKLAAANFILRHIIKGRVLSYLYGVDAEIHEYVVPDKKDICGLPIRALNFPENALITGVIRNQKGFITLGDFRLMPGDKAYVFSLPQSSKNVQSFFKQV